MPAHEVRRLLIYRLGSIGDFVIALPCFRLIRDRYPKAKITLLTNLPVTRRTAPAQQVLSGTKYVDLYIDYERGLRTLSEVFKLRKSIRNVNPDITIYLRETSSVFNTIRDAAFLRWCGISNIIGLPLKKSLRQSRRSLEGGRYIYESEAHRLFRCIAESNDSFEKLENWDLCFTETELVTAYEALKHLLPQDGKKFDLLALCIGTKQYQNDWGQINWQAVLNGLKSKEVGLVMLGASEDWSSSQELIKFWPGISLNLCGQIGPRVSAAVMKYCKLFLGHDSGPMHLAAAVGIQCVVVFSARNLPGKWFPFGFGHKVFYPEMGNGISSIRPAGVIAAAIAILDGSPLKSTQVDRDGPTY